MYDFLMPSVNFMGPDAIKVIGERCKLLGGKNALIVTDPGIIKAGIVDEVVGYIQDDGLKTVIFDGVEPNPRIKMLCQV